MTAGDACNARSVHLMHDSRYAATGLRLAERKDGWDVPPRGVHRSTRLPRPGRMCSDTHLRPGFCLEGRRDGIYDVEQ